jgi:hypothetical protein
VRVQKLLQNVRTRKKKLTELNFEGKITAEFAPYACISRLAEMEHELFNRHKNTAIYSVVSLRDRFCFNMTTNGILRGESLFKCDLSDLCDVIHKDSATGQNIMVMVMRIAVGKTNGLKTLYGRVIRHRLVEQCAIGAIGLYLFARFEYTKECFKFADNSSWFNIKLLIDLSSYNFSVPVSDQNYAKAIKKVCTNLKVPSKHYIHFERTAGSVKAELEEFDGYNINDLGNWNVDTRRDVYSAKLPMKAMRVMAGHAESKGLL